MTAEKIDIVNSDEAPCMKCGSKFLDTGWECNDCGYDNRDWYYPPSQRAADRKEKKHE